MAGSIAATDADAILFGENVNDGFGTSVASAGDLNRDGVDDLIVGADQLFNGGPGKAYVFLGPIAGNIQGADASVILTGEQAQDLFGVSVTGVGDFNGDGFADVMVGASDNGTGGTRSGRTYAFFGPLTGTIAAADANFIVTGQASDELGMSVAGGDLNGDGAGDLLMGAPGFAEGDPGYVAIIFGSAESQSRIRLKLTPRDGPIVIPPEGGTFQYDLRLMNTSNRTVTLDVWVTLSGNGIERTLVQSSLTLAPHGAFQRQFTQAIPGSLNAGRYSLTGSAGTFPQASVSDRFRFEKQ